MNPNATMLICECEHTARRHEDGAGMCLALGCYCSTFHEGGNVAVPRGVKEPLVGPQTPSGVSSANGLHRGALGRVEAPAVSLEPVVSAPPVEVEAAAIVAVAEATLDASGGRMWVSGDPVDLAHDLGAESAVAAALEAMTDEIEDDEVVEAEIWCDDHEVELCDCGCSLPDPVATSPTQIGPIDLVDVLTRCSAAYKATQAAILELRITFAEVDAVLAEEVARRKREAASAVVALRVQLAEAEAALFAASGPEEYPCRHGCGHIPFDTAQGRGLHERRHCPARTEAAS